MDLNKIKFDDEKVRGVLNADIQELAKEYFGEEMTTTELRLIPYIDYCVKNGNDFSLSQINDDELEILQYWEETERVLLSTGKVFITRSFYNFIQNILAVSYVAFVEFID